MKNHKIFTYLGWALLASFVLVEIFQISTRDGFIAEAMLFIPCEIIQWTILIIFIGTCGQSNIKQKKFFNIQNIIFVLLLVAFAYPFNMVQRTQGFIQDQRREQEQVRRDLATTAQAVAMQQKRTNGKDISFNNFENINGLQIEATERKAGITSATSPAVVADWYEAYFLEQGYAVHRENLSASTRILSTDVVRTYANIYLKVETETALFNLAIIENSDQTISLRLQ